MRWPVFIILGFFFLVLDSSMMGILTLHRLGSIAPHIVMTLVVFICLFADKLSALWACLALGLLMDLTLPPRGGWEPMAGAVTPIHLIGPHALGAVFAGYLVIQLRTMVFRQRAITIGALTFIAVLAAGIVGVAIYVVRSWYGEPITYPTNGSAMRELFRQIGIAIYSGLVGIPLGWLLLQTLPFWGFHSTLIRRSTNWR